jgi:serine/threonine protein kinase
MFEKKVFRIKRINQMEKESIYLNPLTKLGKGSYGMVYKTMIHHEPFAVKRNLIDRPVSFLGSIRELDLMMRLKHPNILRITHFLIGKPFTDPIEEEDLKDDQIHFVFELGLYDLHKSIYHYHNAENFLRLMMADILLGLEYMHQRGVIHRDIKPSNILIFKTNTFHAKICDLGLSKPYCAQGKQSQRIMTSCYRAPEVIQCLPYDSKIDLWACGCVFFEMVCKKRLVLPILDDNQLLLEEIQKLLTDDYYLSFIPSTLTPEFISPFISLLRNLLVTSPFDRYDANQSLSHPFFEPIRVYIDSIQSKYQSIQSKPYRLTIQSNHTRKEFCELFSHSLENDYKQSWYKHRTYFLAIDLMDRYLNYCSKNDIQCPNVKLYYYLLMYLSIKFFTTSGAVPYFHTFTKGEWDEKEEWFQIELFLVEKVFQYKIYRSTVYDWHKNKTLSQHEVSRLFSLLLFEPEKVNQKYIHEI